jgi:hypothetical protein
MIGRDLFLCIHIVASGCNARTISANADVKSDCKEEGRYILQSNDLFSLALQGHSADGANIASAVSQPGIPRARKSANPCPCREAELAESACFRSASY